MAAFHVSALSNMVHTAEVSLDMPKNLLKLQVLKVSCRYHQHANHACVVRMRNLYVTATRHVVY